MKLKVLIGLFILSLAFSCKQKSEVEEKATQDATNEAAVPTVTSIQLANYSDDNWKNGVGLTFNMLLVDHSKENEALISKGTELILPNGKKVNYVGFEVKKLGSRFSFNQMCLNDFSFIILFLVFFLCFFLCL